MNRALLIFIVSLAVILSGTLVFAQEKPAPGKVQTDVQEKPSKVTIRVRAKGDFEGTVAQVDQAGKTIAVKNKGVIVTFDVVNPVLKGYRSLDQIKPGDKVSVSYTGDGARITKGIGMYSVPPEETPKARTEKTRPKQEMAKNNKGGPIRVRERTRSREFRDVDNDSDGRITPVELSAVVPNLTVQDFKKYDRNGDGALNESEYNAIKASATRNR